MKDKVCIVTGGGSGIGRAAALLMAARGTRVTVAGRTESKLAAVCGEIARDGGSALAVSLDVADRTAVQRMAAEVLAAWGRIDVLVNNAGHSSAHRMLLTTTPEDIRGTVDSNLHPDPGADHPPHLPTRHLRRSRRAVTWLSRQ